MLSTDDEFNQYYIKIRTILGINAKTIYKELTEALRSDAPSYTTGKRWAKCFHEGWEDVSDESRSGRPILILTNENIERVPEVIEDDRHSTYDNIIAETSLSYGTVERIIHDCLKMGKTTSRWITH